MKDRSNRLIARTTCLVATLALTTGIAGAETTGRLPRVKAPPINSYAPTKPAQPLAARQGRITLAAELTEKGTELKSGLVWRVFSTVPGPDGRLQLMASAKGGTQSFDLAPGQYLVHASFGRAGATKRITVGTESRRENLVLDAGGLELDAVLAGGVRIPPTKLKFSIYEGEDKPGAEKALILPDVSPNAIIRLNAGVYHVVSTYGSVNAVVRSNIVVEAGKLTQATVEHHAAEMTMKLVREAGGEAIADTSWSVLSESGDPVRETVGAFASMVLAEGNYTIVAKNRDKIYQRDFTVVAGRNQDVEVLAKDEAPDAIDGAD